MPFDRKVGDPEKALVKDFDARIKKAADAQKKRFQLFEQWRLNYEGYCASNAQRDGGEKVRTNLIFSTMQTVLPRVYARNPDISITPGEAVSDNQYGLYKKFSKTCESFLNKTFVRGAKLKRRAKACVRSTMITSLGWGKLTLQKEWGEDPVARARLNDAQDNLANIEGLALQLEQSNGSPCDRDLLRGKLEMEIASLQNAPEIVKRKALVLDKLQAEDVLILDDGVQDFDGYQEARAMSHQLWFNSDEWAAKFGFTVDEVADAGMGSPTSYDKPKAIASATPAGNTNSQPGKDSPTTATGGDGSKKWYKVYEIWDREHNLVHTWAEGMKCWIKTSYAPTVGDHWYCFFPLEFNLVDGQFYGLSDVELLLKLQEEYNDTRDDFAKHRAENLPVRVIREGGNLTPQDVTKIAERKSGDFIIIKGGGGQPLSHDMQVMDNPPIDPLNYDTVPIRTDIEMISGASDAANGAVQKAKTATEASYLQEGLASRTSERQDAVEDWVKEMGTYALQIGLQAWTLDEIIEMCGEEAVWPTLEKEVMYDRINLEVRAGSSGKPNSQDEREQWTNLLPQLKEAIAAVGELRQTGQADMADAMIEIVKETFRRFDERVDVDAFFPRGEEGDPAQLAQQLQQENEQLKLQMQELQVEFEKVSKGEYSKAADLQYKASQEQAKAAIETAKESSRQLEANNKAVLERQAIESEERKAKYVADQQIASNERIKIADINAKKEVAIFEAGLRADAERESMGAQERMQQHKTETEAKSKKDATDMAAITALATNESKVAADERTRTEDRRSAEKTGDKDRKEQRRAGDKDRDASSKQAEADRRVSTKGKPADRKAAPAEVPGLKEMMAAIKDMAKAMGEGGGGKGKTKIVELEGEGMKFTGKIRTA